MISAHSSLGVAVRAWYRDVRNKVFTTTRAVRGDLLRALVHAAARDFRLYSHAVGWMRVYRQKIPAAQPRAARVVEWAHQSAIDDGSERRPAGSLKAVSLAAILRGFPRGTAQKLEAHHGIRTPRELRDPTPAGPCLRRVLGCDVAASICSGGASACRSPMSNGASARRASAKRGARVI
jgi:hypothetical protein